MSEENMNTTEAGARGIRTGCIVSDKMQETIVTELEDHKQRAPYGKIIHMNSKVKAHDKNEEAGVGDRVRIEEYHPLSKGKHYRLIEIVGKTE